MAAVVFLAFCGASPADARAQATAAAPAAPLTFPLRAVWSLTLADLPRFPPTYDQTHGYFSLRNDQLAAVSLKDGAIAWSVECPTTTAPAAGDGFIFTAANGTIASRAQTSGDVVWTRPIEGRVVSLTWDTGWLMAAIDGGPLIALRAADGEALWKRDLGAPLTIAPALAGDRVYVSLGDGRVSALALHTGDDIWTHTLAEPAAGILPLDDRVYVGSLDDHFYCLDARNGKRKWPWRNDADVVGAPAIDVRRVYFVALDNLLRALNRNTGSLIWKRGLPMRPSSGPLLTGTLLLVPGLTAEIHAYSAATGAPAGDYVLRGSQNEELQLAAPLHLSADQMIVLVTKNGQVQALAGTPPTP